MSDMIAPPLTEQRNPVSAALDTLPTLEICRLINRQDAIVPVAVAEALPQIAQAVDLMVSTLSHDGRIFYQGAGTSGRLGVLDASELLPTYSLEPGRVVGVIAGGPDALTNSIEAAEDDPDQGRADQERYAFAAPDLLVGGARLCARVAHVRAGDGCHRTAHRAGGRHRQHPHESRHRPKTRSQYAQHGHDGAVGQGLRELDGRCATDKREVAASRRPHRGRGGRAG